LYHFTNYLLVIHDGQTGRSKVVEFLPHEELKKIVDFSLPDVGTGLDGM
jgi:hypothetical protein